MAPETTARAAARPSAFAKASADKTPSSGRMREKYCRAVPATEG